MRGGIREKSEKRYKSLFRCWAKFVCKTLLSFKFIFTQFHHVTKFVESSMVSISFIVNCTYRTFDHSQRTAFFGKGQIFSLLFSVYEILQEAKFMARMQMDLPDSARRILSNEMRFKKYKSRLDSLISDFYEVG